MLNTSFEQNEWLVTFLKNSKRNLISKFEKLIKSQMLRCCVYRTSIRNINKSAPFFFFVTLSVLYQNEVAHTKNNNKINKGYTSNKLFVYIVYCIQRFWPSPLMPKSSDTEICKTIVNGLVVSLVFIIRSLAHGLGLRRSIKSMWTPTVMLVVTFSQLLFHLGFQHFWLCNSATNIQIVYQV